MNDVIFREYDIRGIVGVDLLLDEVYNLGRAIAAYFIEKKPETSAVAIGMDGRIHSDAIKQSLIKALQDSGLNVIFIGVCPSPVLYFALHTLSVQAGIMITASHNPAHYNGLKICLGKESLWGGQVKEIARYYKQKKSVISLSQGGYQEYPLVQDYVQFLVEHFTSLRESSLAALIDCGNGAAGAVLPLLCDKMGWRNVRLLYPDIDGTYPNHEADPVVEANMADVKSTLASDESLQLGVGLDGDCDRMAAMTKTGYLVPGDKLLAVFTQSLITSRDSMSVVCDVKSSSAVINVLKRWGVDVHMSPAGHAIVKEYMTRNDALLGGELSCHFIFRDRYFAYDDGIYAMMRLFEILTHSHKTLEDLMAMFPVMYSSPEFRIEYDRQDKQAVLDAVKDYFSHKKNVEYSFIDGIRVSLDYGWAIVRPSNTQEVMSVRFESDSLEGMLCLQHDCIQALHSVLNVSDIQSFVNKGMSL